MPKPDNAVHASDAQIYGRLLSYVAPYWGAFSLSMAGFILYSLSNVGFMQLVAYIVDSLGGEDPLVDTRVEPILRGLFGEGNSLNRNVIPLAIVFIRGSPSNRDSAKPSPKLDSASNCGSMEPMAMPLPSAHS